LKPIAAAVDRMSDGRSEDDGDGTAHDREEFVHDPLGHVSVRAGMTVGELAAEYGNGGIGAANLHEGVELTAEMFADERTTVLCGLAGAMVPGGMREVVADLVRDGYVDALVTTGANLTHDAIEAIGGKHHHGRTGPQERRSSATCSGSRGSREHDRTKPTDDPTREHDERLREEGVDRIYNVYLPQEHFALLEEHLRERVFPAVEERVSIRELVTALGRANLERNREAGVDESPGIAAAAYENDVPVYVPAVQDSVLGIQAWMYSQVSAFELDALGDMTELSDLAFDAERTGALVVGGGVPKNYVLQTMLTNPGAYDYGVQLTTDPDHTGGLSGATLDEARSWGKLAPDAENVTVVGDATITFPFLVAAARERVVRVD
jgi:deoxyhypusine synthase